MSTHIPTTVRQNILAYAVLHLVPTHSFTRRTILDSMLRDPGHFRDPEGMLEPIFGTGLEPEKALVREWEAQGLQRMRAAFEQPEGRNVAAVKGKGKEVDFEALQGALAARIRWSSETAGEHLVQAHALLATPEHTLSASLPRPLTDIAATLIPKLDPAYTTPDERHPQLGTQTRQQQRSQRPTAPRLTVPLVNPVPLLRYAGTIADEALYVSGAEPETVSGELDWYTRRAGLALIYLHAETHLLGPRPAHAAADTQLPVALAQLDASMERYRAISRANARLAQIEGEVAQFAGFVWKSWGGLFRSRGWIN